MINRFAAELLIPENIFVEAYNRKLQGLKITSRKIPFREFMDVTAYLMDLFMVPYKSIIIRYWEVSILDEDMENRLEKLPNEIVDEFVVAGNYKRLGQRTNDKNMGELFNMLAEAQKEELLPENRINAIRYDFGFKTQNEESEMENNIVSVNIIS